MDNDKIADAAKFVGAVVVVITLVLVILALAGWIVSVCVSTVLGTEFTFWQGVALVILINTLFGVARVRRG